MEQEISGGVLVILKLVVARRQALLWIRGYRTISENWLRAFPSLQKACAP